MNTRSLSDEWRVEIVDRARKTEAQRRAKQRRDCLLLVLFAVAFALFVIFVPRPTRSSRTGRASNTPGAPSISSKAGGFFTDRILDNKEVNR